MIREKNQEIRAFCHYVVFSDVTVISWSANTYYCARLFFKCVYATMEMKTSLHCFSFAVATLLCLLRKNNATTLKTRKHTLHMLRRFLKQLLVALSKGLRHDAHESYQLSKRARGAVKEAATRMCYIKLCSP